MAMTSAAGLFAPAVLVADTRPASRRAWWPAIASRATSSCWPSVTTCNLAPRAERIAGILADRGVDVSGRTILRWVQKFGPALSDQIRRYRKPVNTTWLVDETYAKLGGTWHYLYRGIDSDGQVL